MRYLFVAVTILFSFSYFL